jgi:hypothetical protein
MPDRSGVQPRLRRKAVSDLDLDTPDANESEIETQFNALLAELREAGIIAKS